MEVPDIISGFMVNIPKILRISKKSKSPLITHLSFLSPIVLGVSLGIQCMIAALLIIGLHPRPRHLLKLTDVGQYWVRPEYDVLIYMLGCLATLLFVFTLTVIRQNMLWGKNRQDGGLLLDIKQICYGLLSFLGQVVLILLFKNTVLEIWKQPVFYGLKFGLTGLWALVLVTPAGIALFMIFIIKNMKSTIVPKISMLFDLILPLVIVGLIYIPNVQTIAGRIYLDDMFIHWDGFAVRQALALRHGLVLGRDIFIQYGVGWPVIFSLLNSKTQFLYETVIRTGIIYACIYYVGIYILLRLVTKDIFWSIIGVGLLLHFQFFIRNYPLPFLWETPSSTVLRSPTDVWFFIVSFFVVRLVSKNVFLKIVPALIVGVALLFEFDTGIYLAVIDIFYSLYSIRKSFLIRQKTTSKRKLVTFLGKPALSFLVVLLVFTIIGKSSIFQAEFWYGLFEGIQEYGTGVSNLPFATLKPNIALIIFELMIFVYLLFVANAMIKFLREDDTSNDVFLAGLSLYGLASLLIFMTRSHRLNILYPSIPFWILVAWMGAKTQRALGIYFKNKFYGNPHPIRLIKLASSSVLVLICWPLLFNSSAYQKYPNVVNQLTQRTTTDGLCLMKQPRGICGLTDANKASIEKFTTTVSFLKELKSSGKTVAIFDDGDTLLSVAIDTYPYFRYRPGEVFTKKQLAHIHNQIRNEHPDYIIIGSEQVTNSVVISETRALISNYYKQKDTIEEYEVWR